MEGWAMRLIRLRFTLRRMLAVIALLAVLLAIGRWGHYRYLSRGITKTYFLGDLIEVRLVFRGAIPANVNSKLAEQAELLKSSITPDVWWFPTRTVNPFPAAASLTIVHTKEGHEQVGAWFKERRNRFWAAHGIETMKYQ
jgi:hypothetical protein